MHRPNTASIRWFDVTVRVYEESSRIRGGFPRARRTLQWFGYRMIRRFPGAAWRTWSRCGHASDVALGHDHVVEEHGARETQRIVWRIVLQPDPVEIQIGVAAPPEAFERRAARALREVASAPCAVRESLTEVAHLDAIDPDGVLAIERGHGVVQLHHLLDAGPLARRHFHIRAVQQRVAPVIAIAGDPHVHPVVVMIEVRPIVRLFSGCREAIVAGRLDAGLRIGPGHRRVVATHPDAIVHVGAGCRVFDVVAHVQRVVDARGQQLIEMAACVHSAPDGRNGERMRARTARVVRRS